MSQREEIYKTKRKRERERGVGEVGGKIDEDGCKTVAFVSEVVKGYYCKVVGMRAESELSEQCLKMKVKKFN